MNILVSFVCLALFAASTLVKSQSYSINIPIFNDKIASGDDDKSFLFSNHNKFHFGVQVSESTSIQLSVKYEDFKLDKSTELSVQWNCLSLASPDKEDKSTLTYPETSKEVKITNDCVPFAQATLKAKSKKFDYGKLRKLLTVTITVKSADSSKWTVDTLNAYYFSKEALSARTPVNNAVCEFHDRINTTRKYSFIDSPNAQVLLQKDYDKFGSCQQMFDSVKQLNDLIEFYDHLAGLDPYRFGQADLIRYRPQYHKLFYKAECDQSAARKYEDDLVGKISYNNRGARLAVDSLVTLRLAPSPDQSGRCAGDAYAYYTWHRIAIIGRSVTELIGNTRGTNWGLFHETAHHYDLYTYQEFFDFRESYVNIYSALYQARFKLDKPEAYWMHGGKRTAIQQSYKNRDLNFNSDLQTTTDALLAIFNSFPGLLRAFNIRHRRDLFDLSSQIHSNFIAVVCDFMLDVTGYDVGPFFDYLGAPKPGQVSNVTNNREFLLPLAHRFEAQYNGGSALLFPCFMLDENRRHDRLRIVDEESYPEWQSALTLCQLKNSRSPSGKTYKISIMKNTKYAQLNGSDVILNGRKLDRTFEDVLENGLEIDDERQISVLSVESRDKMANIIPTYIYKADKEVDISSSFTAAYVPEERLVFKGLGDDLFMVAHIRRRDRTFLRYRFLSAGPHSYFAKETYVSWKVLNDLNQTVFSLNIKGEGNTYDTKNWSFIELKANYQIVIEAKEPGRIEVNDKKCENEKKIVLREHPLGYFTGQTGSYCKSLERFHSQLDSSKSKGFAVEKKRRLLDRFAYLQKVRSNLQNLCNGKPDSL